MRWWQTPTPALMKGLFKEVDAASKKAGRKLIYMAIIHAEEPPPNPELRAALYGFFHDLQSPCEQMHLVVLGRGLMNSIIRSVITGGILANGFRKFITVHDSVEAAIQHVASSENKAVASYMSPIAAAGFLAS